MSSNETFFQLRLNSPSKNSKKENDDIIIFGSEYLISLVEKCALGFFDGTFKTSPVGFTQILVFLVLNPDTNIFTPIFYIFASSKSEECYFLALSGINMVISKYGLKNKIKIVNVDFECAIHNAFKKVFPEIRCYFLHLVIFILIIKIILFS